MAFGKKEKARVADNPATSTRKAQPFGRLYTSELGIAALLAAMFAVYLWGVGETITGPEQCFAELAKVEVPQKKIDWDAPATVRELIEIENYGKRKQHRNALAACPNDSRETIITCGFIKCGGLFTLDMKSSEQVKAERRARIEAINRHQSEIRSKQNREERIRKEEARAHRAKEAYEADQRRARNAIEAERVLLERQKGRTSAGPSNVQ